MAQECVKICGMKERLTQVTVKLYPRAFEAKERLTVEWDSRKVFSAALLLFDQQDAMKQKELIRKLVQGHEEEKKVKPDVRYGDRRSKPSDKTQEKP